MNNWATNNKVARGDDYTETEVIRHIRNNN